MALLCINKWYVFIVYGLLAGVKCLAELNIVYSTTVRAAETVTLSGEEWTELKKQQRSMRQGRETRRAMDRSSS